MVTNTNKPTAQEIRNNLDQFYGTEAYHVLNASTILTDGAKYVADSCGAYWLMDIISSWQTVKTVREEYFQCWKMTVHTDKNGGKSATIICEDGNNNFLCKQNIEYTNFPLGEITLWAEWSSDGNKDILVIYLPSEH